MSFLEIDKKNPADIAAKDRHTTLSYGDVLSFANEIKKVIPERALIIIISENSVGSLSAYLAFLSIRVVPIILNSSIDKESLDNYIQLYSPSFVWLPESSELISTHSIYRKYSYKLCITGKETPEIYKDLAMLLPTSGSTGSPKLVRHSYSNIEANAKNVAELFNLNKDDKAITILPLHFTMGLSIVSSHIQAGATVLLYDGTLVEREFWDYIKSEKATSFTGVPYSYEILQKLRFFRMDLPHLNLITQGGGKMSEKLFRECVEYAETKQKRFIATYGQTEGTARMAYLPSHMAKKKTLSIGKAIPNGLLYLVDESGKQINGANEEGELVFEGPNVTLGYAKDIADLSLGDINNGILFTGDLAIRDEDGYFFITGRKSKFLKIFGTRISLDETERIISEKFNINCFCTGNDQKMDIFISDENLVQEVEGFIVDRTNLFNKAFDVKYSENITRSESGKIIFSPK